MGYFDPEGWKGETFSLCSILVQHWWHKPAYVVSGTESTDCSGTHRLAEA